MGACRVVGMEGDEGKYYWLHIRLTETRCKDGAFLQSDHQYRQDLDEAGDHA